MRIYKSKSSGWQPGLDLKWNVCTSLLEPDMIFPSKADSLLFVVPMHEQSSEEINIRERGRNCKLHVCVFNKTLTFCYAFLSEIPLFYYKIWKLILQASLELVIKPSLKQVPHMICDKTAWTPTFEKIVLLRIIRGTQFQQPSTQWAPNRDVSVYSMRFHIPL